MSVSLWRWEPVCDGRCCPGDCDECGFEPTLKPTLKPTAQRVLDYLMYTGPATVREMQDALGMTEIRSRISDIKKAGYKIARVFERGENRFGEPVRFARYSVVRRERNE